MATEKDIALAAYLLKLTQEGKLKWEPTARKDEFTASIKGKYNVVLSKGGFGRFIRTEGDPEYGLKLIDEKEQELLRMTEHEFPPLVDLFELVRRASFNVDAIIDEILSDDPSDSA